MVLASPFPAPRGTQAWISELSTALAELGHDVHLFCYGAGLGGGAPGGVTLHRAPILPGVRADLDSAPSAQRPLNDAALLATLLRKLPRIRPSVVHGHNHEGGLAAALAGRFLGFPVVHQIHGSLSEELVAWLEQSLSTSERARHATGRLERLGRRLAAHAGRVLDHSVPRLAHQVLTLDEEAAATAGLRATKAVALPPGVSVPEQPLEPGSPRLPSDEAWIVYPGNLDPYQSLGLLADAWPLVRRELPSARLALVTHDRGGHRLASLPGVRLMRPRSSSDAQSLVASSRFVVIPRTGGGGYPLKLLNALGLGVPVVASRPSAKGLDERAGVMSVECSAEALAAGVLGLLRDEELRLSLRDNALSFARANSWRRVAEVVAGVYDRLRGEAEGVRRP